MIFIISCYLFTSIFFVSVTHLAKEEEKNNKSKVIVVKKMPRWISGHYINPKNETIIEV